MAVVAAVLEAIEEMIGAVLSTVTVIDDEVADCQRCPARRPTIDFEPLDVAVVSHVTEYREEVSSGR